jgi:hypothetical protein
MALLRACSWAVFSTDWGGRTVKGLPKLPTRGISTEGELTSLSTNLPLATVLGCLSPAGNSDFLLGSVQTLPHPQATGAETGAQRSDLPGAQGWAWLS